VQAQAIAVQSRENRENEHRCTMPDKEELIRKARELGEALAAHPTVKAYIEAQQAVRNDEDARKLLQDYQNHAAHMQQLETEGKPIEVGDKHKLRDLEAKMYSQASLKNLMRYQTEYVTLMNAVNRAIDEPVNRLGRPEPSA
jgi:cell fate (sporulation/competence/biofilm development) regulator YlbF (YheA/YmcA/DUF963 family)